MSSPQCRRALDDVIRRLGIAEAMSERAIEAVAFRLIDEIRFSAKLGSQNRAPLSEVAFDTIGLTDPRAIALWPSSAELWANAQPGAKSRNIYVRDRRLDTLGIFTRARAAVRRPPPDSRFLAEPPPSFAKQMPALCYLSEVTAFGEAATLAGSFVLGPIRCKPIP
jgi:hypothetical protein